MFRNRQLLHRRKTPTESSTFQNDAQTVADPCIRSNDLSENYDNRDGGSLDSAVGNAEKTLYQPVCSVPSDEACDYTVNDTNPPNTCTNNERVSKVSKNLINLSFSETMDDNAAHSVGKSGVEMDIRIRKSRQSKRWQKRGIKMREKSPRSIASESYTAGHFPEEKFILNHSDQEMLDDSVTNNQQGAGPHRDIFNVRSHLDARLKHLQNNSEKSKSNIHESQRMLDFNNMNLTKIEESLNNLKIASQPIYELKEKVAILAGLYSAKAQRVKKSLDTCYNNRIEVADWTYRTIRWFLCDVLALDNHSTDYSLGKLDEINSQGEYVHVEIQSALSQRANQIHQILTRKNQNNESLNSTLNKGRSMFNAIVSCRCGNIHYTIRNRWDWDILNHINGVYESPNNSGDTRQLFSLFTLYNVQPELENIHGDLMADVVSHFDDFPKVLEMINVFLRECRDNMEGFDLNAGLCCVYILYIRLDLLVWDPLAISEVLQNRRLSTFHWYKYLAKDWQDVRTRMIQDVLLRSVTCAIDSWSIASSVQTLGLVWLIEDVLALDRKLRDTICGCVMKTLQERLVHFCVDKPNDSAPISSMARFEYMKHHIVAACNILQMHNVMSTLDLLNFVLDTMFLNYVLPIIDVKSGFDALLLLALFQCIHKTCSQCMYIDSKAVLEFKNVLNKMTLETWDRALEHVFIIKGTNGSAIGNRPTLQEYRETIEKIQHG